MRETAGSPRRVKVAVAAFLAAVFLGGLLSVCTVFGPAWIVGGGPGLTRADRLNAENDVRSTLLQGLGGLLALGGVTLGALVTLRQVRANREGHSIELFTKAIDLLASDQVEVRHGGVYALERLSGLDDSYRGMAHALLTAFVCRHAPWSRGTPESGLPPERAPLQGGLADDVAAALAVLSRGKMVVAGNSSELERVDLRHAELSKYSFPSACFKHSNLNGANLSGANLSGANLAGATLSDTLLRKTDLSGADLTGADLTRADLSGADLDRAILLGADLTNAKLSDISLSGVVADNTTTWPHGFTPPQPGT